MILQVSRGFAFSNISQGLHQLNGRDNGRYPGLFFFSQLYEDERLSVNRLGAENLARSMADIQQNQVVIAFNITRDNFSLLDGRVFVFREHGGYSFPVTPGTFDHLIEQQDGIVLVNLEGLQPKVISQLGVEIGVNVGATFEYRSYEEWLQTRREGDVLPHSFRK